MLRCWKWDPVERPHAEDLRIELQNLVRDEYYLDLDNPYEDYNAVLTELQLGYEREGLGELNLMPTT